MNFDLIVSSAGYESGAAYYAQVVFVSNGYVWDYTNSRASATVAYADTVIPMAEINSMGVFAVDVPSITAGKCKVIIRKRSGADPAAADNVVEVLTFGY